MSMAMKLATSLYGNSSNQGGTRLPGTTMTYSGTAVEDSSDGTVKVLMDGDLVGREDIVGTQWVGTGADLPVTLPVEPIESTIVLTIDGDECEFRLDGRTVHFDYPVSASAEVVIDFAHYSTSSYIELPTSPSVKAGDTVSIMVVDGKPMVGGSVGWGDNLDLKVRSIEADYVKTETLEANYAHITNGVIDNAKIGYADVEGLNAQVATIADAQIASATITQAQVQNLSTDYAHITNGEIDNAAISYANVSNLSSNYAHITSGEIDNATISYANVSNLSSNYAHITQGVIDNATIGYASVNGLDAHAASIADAQIATATITQAQVQNLSVDYAQANLANVDNAWIENGTVKDGAITNAMINSVSANKLTAGTIDASNITVTNLNADNITTGTINGQRIGQGSLSLDKLADAVYTEAEVDTIVDGLNDRIDGAIETFTGTVVPTLNNSPASSWTTTALKDQHVGDIYYVVNSQSQQDGYCYRFTKSSNTYSWQLIKDSDVTAALSRLQTAEGKIGDIETFDTTVSSFMTTTNEEITSLKTRTTNVETSLGDKVSTSTFNELSQTVDANSASITSLSTITTNNGLTASTNITNTVNSVSQTASGNSSKLTQLTTTLGTNADGTTKAGDIVHRTSAVEQGLDGITTRVSKTEAHLAGLYATSSTAAGTTAKTATIVPSVTGWELSSGTTVTVKFTNANTATTPTLNVNSTGAKTIKDYAGNALTEAARKWEAGTALTFTYDGTYWRLQDSSVSERINSAESAITQNAENIELKVSETDITGNYLVGKINLDATTATIAANRVNIEGAAIFTGSGRLSQTSLNAAYDANGAASGAVSALTTDLASSSGTTVIDGGHITANSITIGKTTGIASTSEVQAAQSDATDALKRTYVSIRVTAINYSANTATLDATLFIDGVAYRDAAAVTLGVSYAWLKDGTAISGATSQTYSVQNTTGYGLDHAYSCKCSW